ncbi:hypothetical protein KC717_03160 [Candidatus Dojkabacteria bacterium]|uniref:Uncharacterized protein n=1 Tax=Candidatus Dojkabacteria bacterium TaxID=2099670 RepID=A0A955L7T1_9BACT|nr:hypothetical protein [Candidatus Dojkabacteria bacterium]
MPTETHTIIDLGIDIYTRLGPEALCVLSGSFILFAGAILHSIKYGGPPPE